MIEKLDNSLFWDVDISKLDDEASSRLIIERVFSLGNVESIREVVSYYGRSRVAKQLGDMNYLDPKTLNFVSILFNKPKSEFQCSTPKSSTSKHWNS